VLEVGIRQSPWMSAALALLLLVFCSFASVAQSFPPLFQTEEQAQENCPNDTVVWLNLNSGVYHFRGQRYYANTKSGAFVCEKEADAAGERRTENGQ
jgi:hypothetical protein